MSDSENISMNKKENILGENIAFIREYKKLTFEQFAKEAESTPAQMKSYVTGTIPPISVMCNIADYAGITIDILVRQKITSSNLMLLQEPFIDFNKSMQIQLRVGLVIKILLHERFAGKYSSKDLQRILHLSQHKMKALIDEEEVDLTIDTIINLIEVFKVNGNFLLTGIGPMFSDSHLAQAYQKLNEKVEALEKKISR